MKPKLFIMCGLSGSGKSSIAKDLAAKHNADIVSSDIIREELFGSCQDQSDNGKVFNIFNKRIRESLNNNKNVIADATNITIKSRRAIIENVRKLDIEKICYIVPKKFEQCIADNVNREQPVQKEVITAQRSKFQIPFKEEGFNEIVIYDMEYGISDKNTLLELMWRMLGFDQENPHHNLDLGLHCEFTYKMFSSKRDALDSYKNGFLLGAKLHDYGKLFTKKIDENGIGHFIGHENVGCYEILTKLYNLQPNWNNQELLDCCFLINYHMLPFNWNTDKSKNKWRRIFGEEKYNMLLRFHKCDKERYENFEEII